MKSESAHLRKKSTFDRGSHRFKAACNYSNVTTISPKNCGTACDRDVSTIDEMLETNSYFPPQSHPDNRRASIFSTLKKIFKHGKMDSESIGPAPKRSKHEHAISEPFQFPVPDTAPALPEESTHRMPHRAVSATHTRHVPSPLHLSKPSGSVVPFPRSARLKPLNLGTPTIAPQLPTLGRRQSLPEVTSHNDNPPYSAPFSPILEQSPEIKHAKRLSELENAERPRTSLRAFRRRSRSEGNLKKKQAESNQNTKDDEVQDWRENVQHIVWQASGLRNQGSMQGSLQHVSTEYNAEPAYAAAGQGFGSRRGDTPPSSHGKDISKDLEDRVAKLEAGVQDFQDALRYLTNSDLRRTDTASSRNLARVPSILINSLHHIDMPRPSTSEGTTLVVDGRTRTPTPHSMSSGLEKRPRSTSGEKRANADTVSTSAFMNLYEMVEDERAARLRLEHQIQDLQQDLAELKCHVTIKPTLGGYTTVDGRRHWANKRFSRSHDDLASRTSSESSYYPRSINDDEEHMKNDWPFDNDDEIF